MRKKLLGKIAEYEDQIRRLTRANEAIQDTPRRHASWSTDRQAAMIRRAGIEPVFLVPPITRATPASSPSSAASTIST